MTWFFLDFRLTKAKPAKQSKYNLIGLEHLLNEKQHESNIVIMATVVAKQTIYLQKVFRFSVGRIEGKTQFWSAHHDQQSWNLREIAYG